MTPNPGPATIADYRLLAEAALNPMIWRYLQDGEGGRDTAALAAMRPWPRPLRPVRGGHTRLTLFGQPLDHPFLLAPIAYQRLFHRDGEAASAMAASAQGGQTLISSLASQPLAAIARAGRREDGSGPWFQLYWQGERARSLRLLRKAEQAGCAAIVLTVDAPVKQATLQLPGEVCAVNLEAPAAMALPAGGSAVFDGWMAQAPTWDDLAWLRGQTCLPLLVKGILHPDDAEQALALGCDGLVVSSHGGRVLAAAPASLDALPAIAKRIDGRVPVLFDSGIRHGRDAFVALALGACAVLVGRPYVWGLTANGALGVAHVIRLLRDELEMTMALCGCGRLGDIDPHCLDMRP